MKKSVTIEFGSGSIEKQKGRTKTDLLHNSPRRAPTEARGSCPIPVRTVDRSQGLQLPRRWCPQRISGDPG